MVLNDFKEHLILIFFYRYVVRQFQSFSTVYCVRILSNFVYKDFSICLGDLNHFFIPYDGWWNFSFILVLFICIFPNQGFTILNSNIFLYKNFTYFQVFSSYRFKLQMSNLVTLLYNRCGCSSSPAQVLTNNSFFVIHLLICEMNGMNCF